MELNDFVTNFAELFEKTDANEIKADTIFKEIEEWSSLVALGLIAMADEEYHVRIKGDDIKNSATILDLFNIIKSRT